MKKIDMTNVQEAGESRRIPAGAYAGIITKVEDFPDKEYLKVTYDIAEGDFRGYYSEQRKRYPDSEWIGAYVKSYKPKALPMFKRFCTAVSHSNQNFVFDGGAINSDERTLIGKKVGLVLQEEEYYGNDGNLKTRIVVARECDVAKLAEQRIPGVKKLKEEPTAKPAQAPTNPGGFMDLPQSGLDEVPFV